MTWRTYIITTNNREWRIYAPSLGEAFHIARLNGGGSLTLTCRGVI